MRRATRPNLSAGNDDKKREREGLRDDQRDEFAASVPPGSKVHLPAFWYNPRGDRLPASTYIGGGVAGQVA